ncbi:hypothetical protein MCHI_002121, partial [Candidatus Magnetoovum chiemensis]
MTINEILDFHFDKEEFVNSAKHIVRQETKNIIERNVKQLEKLLERLIAEAEEGEFKAPQTQTLKAIYEEFMKTAPQGLECLKDAFSQTRKIRNLSWALTCEDSKRPSIILSDYLSTALQLLDSKWKDGYIHGLIIALLDKWTYLHSSRYNKNGDILRKFIDKKRSSYDGEGKRLELLKQNIHYLTSADSPTALAKRLANYSIEDGIKFFGLKESALTYSYFEALALSYVEICDKKYLLGNKISDILQFLSKHSSRDTSKKVISMIIRVCSEYELSNKEELKTQAFTLIGDPANNYEWSAWTGANDEEKQQLRKAQDK